MRGCSGGAEEKAWYRNFNHAMRVEELTLPRPGPAQLHQAGLAPALEMEEAGAGWCCAAACSTQNLISINCGRAGAGRGCRGRAGAAVWWWRCAAPSRLQLPGVRWSAARARSAAPRQSGRHQPPVSQSIWASRDTAPLTRPPVTHSYTDTTGAVVN